MVGLLPSGPSSFATSTAPEIVDTAERPGSVLVVPVGSVEQHGAHLPAATDSILVAEVASAAADRLVDTANVPILVAPTLWSGHSPHHLPFGGTLTGEFDTLLDLLNEVLDSGLENGFDAAVIVNGHGGNADLVGATVSAVGREHPAADVLGLTYFELAAPFVDEIRDSDVGGMAHGGEFETSLLLHLYPELVCEERDGTPLDEPYDRTRSDLLVGGALSVYRSFDEHSDSGAIGDPELATAEKGEELFDGVVEEFESILRETHERTR